MEAILEHLQKTDAILARLMEQVRKQARSNLSAATLNLLLSGPSTLGKQPSGTMLFQDIQSLLFLEDVAPAN